MKMSVRCSCIAIVAMFLTYQLAQAAIYREPHTKHPERDACVSTEFNVTIEVGKRDYIPEKCIALDCNDAYEVVLSTCLLTTVENPCFLIPGNNSLLYPKCCEQAECPKEDNNSTLEVSMTL